MQYASRTLRESCHGATATRMWRLRSSEASLPLQHALKARPKQKCGWSVARRLKEVRQGRQPPKLAYATQSMHLRHLGSPVACQVL